MIALVTRPDYASENVRFGAEVSEPYPFLQVIAFLIVIATTAAVLMRMDRKKA